MHDAPLFLLDLSKALLLFFICIYSKKFFTGQTLPYITSSERAAYYNKTEEDPYARQNLSTG
jgi:hypothetical protein